MHADKRIFYMLLASLTILLLASSSLAAGCLTGSTAQDDTAAEEDRQLQLEEEKQAGIRYVMENTAQLATMIHEMVNEERKENGLDALKWDQQLANIALSHSRDMAERGYFDHYSPEGEDFEDRYMRYGYTRETTVGDRVYRGGENLFLNNVVSSYTYNEDTGEVFSYDINDLEELASSTVQGWMDSPGHRENILTPFSREGIGIYLNDQGEVYITENFS